MAAWTLRVQEIIYGDAGSARGAARINASDDVPNTNSTEFAEFRTYESRERKNELVEPP